MNPDERLSNLEKTVQGFNIVTNEAGSVQGGFGEFEQKDSVEDRIAHLEKLHENFRIVGGANITVEGSLQTGYAICATCPQDEGIGSPVPPGGTTPPPVCGGATEFSADFTFNFQDSPTPPIGHAFSGSGTVTGSINQETCCGTGNETVFVTVIEHGEFGDITCEPDADVTLTAGLCYNPETEEWTVTAEVFLGDNSTNCGPSSWPGISIVSSVADTGLGGHALVPDTGPPSITGTVTFAVT